MKQVLSKTLRDCDPLVRPPLCLNSIDRRDPKRGRSYPFYRRTPCLKKLNQQMCSVYPITYSHQQFNQRTVHPFSPAYAVTICKSQGKTLHKVILWIDVPVPPPGTIYVALSRVRRQSDMYFWTIPTIKQFQPVHFLAVNE